MDDKLALNEHERITNIYATKFTYDAREKNMLNVKKYINIGNKKGYKENTK